MRKKDYNEWRIKRFSKILVLTSKNRQKKKWHTTEPGAVEALGGERTSKPFLEGDALTGKGFASRGFTVITAEKDCSSRGDHQHKHYRHRQTYEQQASRLTSCALRHQLLQR